MLTANYMNFSNQHDFQPHVKNEVLQDPHGSATPFGLIGCLDAPNTLPAGATYWMPYGDGGWSMPRSLWRPH